MGMTVDAKTFAYYTKLGMQVQRAYLNRVNLSAQGFYKTPKFGINFDDGEDARGNVFLYHTYGAGCSIVEVDTLTGNFQVRIVNNKN